MSFPQLLDNKKEPTAPFDHQIKRWSGRQDSNLRPPSPGTRRATKLRYVPNNQLLEYNRNLFFCQFFFPNFGWTVKSISKARCQGNALSKERS